MLFRSKCSNNKNGRLLQAALPGPERSRGGSAAAACLRFGEGGLPKGHTALQISRPARLPFQIGVANARFFKSFVEMPDKMYKIQGD